MTRTTPNEPTVAARDAAGPPAGAHRLTASTVPGPATPTDRRPGAVRLGRFRLSSVVAASLAAYTASRLGFLLAVMFWQRHGGGSVADVWDGGWFLKIAEHGYPDGFRYAGDTKSAWAFLPLYPMLVAAVHALGVPASMAALWLNVVLGAAVAVVLARLATQVVGEDAATRACVLFWFFPGSVVLAMAYSEAVFLLLVCLALLALVQQQWLLAGVATALAGATRAAALALIVPGLVAAVVAVRRSGSWRPLLAAVVAPLGLLAFLAYGQLRSGDWLIWREAQDDWDQSIDFGLRAPGSIRREIFRHGNNGDTWLITLAVLALLLAAVALLIVSRPRLPMPLWVYTIATAVILLASTNVFTKPRFVLTLVPLFLAVGAKLPQRAYPIAVGTVASMLPLVGYLYLGGPHVIP